MYSYYIELDIEECKKRISEEVKGDRFLMGKVNFEKYKFWILKKNPYVRRNSFPRLFYGELINKE